jgi:Fic family protein
LKVLREHALIGSAVSSNRIEGVEADQARVGTIVFGSSRLRDRNEEEIRGYRDALQLIHEQGPKLTVSERTIRVLHRLSRGGRGDAGKYKQKDSEIIENLPDGRRRVRFVTVPARKTPQAVRAMMSLWKESLRQGHLQPLIAVAAMNLDFLCIHPFRDGNGRVSRLLLLLQCYHLGYEVGRYVSLERTIEENKERYYETLEQSSQGWHEGRHDPWPYVNFLLYVLKSAYLEFEKRSAEIGSPRGTKAEIVNSAIRAHPGEFRLADIERACPSVGREWIRKILSGLKESGAATCRGRGPAARWRFREGKGTALK